MVLQLTYGFQDHVNPVNVIDFYIVLYAYDFIRDFIHSFGFTNGQRDDIVLSHHDDYASHCKLLNAISRCVFFL